MTALPISVVVAAYNVGRYIREAVESVLVLSPPVAEVIVIDDGSTDTTTEVLAAIPHDGRLRIERTENRGLGPARNLGRTLAVSEYVYFLDGDDALAADFCAAIADVLTEAGERGVRPDLICFGGTSFKDEGAKTDFRPDYTRRTAGWFGDGPTAVKALVATHSFFGNSVLYVSRRTLWNEDGLEFKPILHEDEEVALPLFAAAGAVSVIEVPLYRRRVRDDSIMTRRFGVRNADGFRVILQSLLRYPVGTDQRFARLRGVIRARLFRFTMQYLAVCRDAGLQVDVRLCTKVLARIRSAEVAFTIVRTLIVRARPTS